MWIGGFIKNGICSVLFDGVEPHTIPWLGLFQSVREGYTVVEAGLNLFSQFDGQMLVLSVVLSYHPLHSPFWDLFQIEFNHISCLIVNPISKSRCGRYFGNLLVKNLKKEKKIFKKGSKNACFF